MCDFTLINKIENLPENLEYFSCSFTQVNKIQNLPSSLLYFNFVDTNISIIENLPLCLQTIHFTKHHIRFIDNIPFEWFDGQFTLKKYNTIKRIQIKIKKRFILKNKATRIIQYACENWIWKPICKDGKMGINCRLSIKSLNLKN